MTQRILFRNVDAVLPGDGFASASGQIRRGNVLIGGGKVLDVDASPDAGCDRVIDATGLHLLPGVVDDQVHFREPGLTHKEDLATASAACAAGGVTSFLEMPNTVPPAVTIDGVRAKERLAAGKSVVNYGFYIGATPDNVAQLAAAVDVPGIKIFIGSSTGNLLVDDQDALERIFAETTLPICAHCEDESTVHANAAAIGVIDNVAAHSRIRDVAAAVTATKRAIDLARRHHHRFHVLHVSTGEEVPLLGGHGDLITAEVCPHHLGFNVDDYPRLGSKVQMNPSVKSAADNAALWKALSEDAIQVIATDHAPHTLDEKAKPYPLSPSGLPAVENSLRLMLDAASAGRVTLVQIAHWMSDAPARVWGIVGKGRIETGYDADLVLVDTRAEHRVVDGQQWTKAKWSPWAGQTLTGGPVETFVGGVSVWSAAAGLNRAHRGAKLRFDHGLGGFWATGGGTVTPPQIVALRFDSEVRPGFNQSSPSRAPAGG